MKQKVEVRSKSSKQSLGPKRSLGPRGSYSSLEKKKTRYAYIFILPLIIGLAVFFIPNIINTVMLTMNDISITENGYRLTYVGGRNYVEALTNNLQFRVLLQSALVQLVTDVPIVLIFSLFIAVLLNQKFKGRILARTIFFVPVLLATGVIARVENMSGLLSTMNTTRVIEIGTATELTQSQGIRDLLLSMNFNTTLINVVVGAADGIYRMVLISGMQIFIILAGLQEIPESLYEAAKVEGCDGWQLFWKITFPMISPQLVVSAVYTVVDAYTRPNNPLFDYTNQVAFNSNQYGYATAMSFVYFIGVAIMIAIAGFAVSKLVFYNE